MCNRFKYILFLLSGISILLSAGGCSTIGIEKRRSAVNSWSCNEEADRALMENDYQKGIQLHKQFLEKEPFNGLALYHLGYAYGQIGNLEEEILYYEKAVSVGFYENNIFYNLGMAYGEQNRIDKSIMAFKRALEQDPDNYDNHLGLAIALQKNSSLGQSEKEYLKAIHLRPDDSEAGFLLGVLYMNSGNIKKAEEQFLRVLEIDPDHITAREYLKDLGGDDFSE
jgi:tetratricopeptide (TPR) repeat protein